MDWILSFLTLPLVLSVLSFCLGLFTFWWVNLRRGKLSISPPRSGALFNQLDQKTILRLPFVFENTGAKSIIIQNMRLVFANPRPSKPLDFIATMNKLIDQNDVRALATQFPVKAKETLHLVCEFQQAPTGSTLTEGTHTLRLEGLIGNSKEWKHLQSFPLYITAHTEDVAKRQLVTFDNTPSA